MPGGPAVVWVPRLWATVLDRVRRRCSCSLQDAPGDEAFLVESAGTSTVLAAGTALSATRPDREKRWVDGVLARKKGLGF